VKKSIQAKPGLDIPQIEVKSRAQLRAWLKINHQSHRSVWCVTWKKASGAWRVPYSDIVDEVLCFGWIDSLPRALDADRTMLLLSPRKPKSNWSLINKTRVAGLTADGLMSAAGLRAVEEAKSNGKWSFLEDVDKLTVPQDLASALAATQFAQANWDAFPRSVRRGILEWIKNAKAAETRAKRISETAQLAGKNVRANQYRQKLPGQTKPADPQ
jgi:uncharacterized protein YdeI (YjbR/CyaY-like superfamily)